LFQGALVFQVLIFGVLYFFTKKKDILYYSLFLLFAAVYFFVNAPYTFFDIPEKTVWASSWYDHVNTPLIIVENLFYLLFLKAFFYDVTTDKSVVWGLLITVRIIPFLIALFILLSVLQVNSQSIFYTVNMISVVPAAAVAYIILKRKIPFASLVANGLICTIAGTSVTVYMIVLGNNGVHKLFTVGYPLFFIRLGILGDMIFYLAAILKKWHLQEKQFAVEKIQSLIHERLRISRELHDDIGSTLGSISIYSEVARNRSQKNENADEAISKIGVASRELIEKISDIVWSINPNNESFEQLQNRMQAFAAMILTPRNIYYDFKADEATKKINLTSEQRKNIFLIYKEAIHNIVKYAECEKVEIHLSLQNDQLAMNIRDNGKGFDPLSLEELAQPYRSGGGWGDVYNGNGLKNMQTRADDIGAILKIHSAIHGGSTIELRMGI